MGKTKMSLTDNRERARKIFQLLKKAYPDARCMLDHANALELLVATILAAQCTDERVNIVTKTLFKRYKTPGDYASVPQEELETAVRTCGFFRQKARTIRNACAKIVRDFGGNVPGSMDELLKLDGVGRKTANVVLGECFNTPGIIVDTHCRRVAYRLGFTRHTDPDKIEQDLMRLWPQKDWTLYSHCIVFHGRRVCQARTPKCAACLIRALCPLPQTREAKT